MFQLVLAVLLIAVSVIIQAAFMSVGLRVLKRAHDRQDPVLQRQPTLVVVVWVLYLLLPIGVALGLASAWSLLPLLTLPLAAPLVRTMLTETGPALNAALKGTGRLHLFFGVLLALGMIP